MKSTMEEVLAFPCLGWGSYGYPPYVVRRGASLEIRRSCPGMGAVDVAMTASGLVGQHVQIGT